MPAIVAAVIIEMNAKNVNQIVNTERLAMPVKLNNMSASAENASVAPAVAMAVTTDKIIPVGGIIERGKKMKRSPSLAGMTRIGKTIAIDPIEVIAMIIEEAIEEMNEGERIAMTSEEMIEEMNEEKMIANIVLGGMNTMIGVTDATTMSAVILELTIAVLDTRPALIECALAEMTHSMLVQVE